MDFDRLFFRCSRGVDRFLHFFNSVRNRVGIRLWGGLRAYGFGFLLGFWGGCGWQ